MNRPNFLLKGTALPKLSDNTRVSCVGWTVGQFHNRNFSNDTFFSYGFTDRHGITCILAEKVDFDGRHYWEVPLDTIEKLAEEQGLIVDKSLNHQNMDFTVKGTKLPKVPVNTVYWWHHGDQCSKFHFEDDKLISYGSVYRNGETYILAESPEYKWKEYYQIKKSEVERLAIEQGMIVEKIIGYKAPYDMFLGEIKKDEVFVKWGSNSTYVSEQDKRKAHQVPNEIVEKWEPVYEENKEETLVLGSNNISIVFNKEGVFVNSERIYMPDVISLLNPKSKSVGRESSSSNFAVILVDATYQIGCSTFTFKELEQIINTHRKFIK